MLVQIRQLPSLTLSFQLLFVLTVYVGCGAPPAELSQAPSEPAKTATLPADVPSQEVLVEPTQTRKAAEIAEASVETQMMANEPLAEFETQESQGEGVFKRDATAARVRSPQASVDHSRIKPSPTTASRSWSNAPQQSMPMSIDDFTSRDETAEEARHATAQLDGVAVVSTPDQSTQPASSVAPAEKRPIEVEVFYATDRKRVAAIGAGDMWKVIRWSLQLGILALLTGVIGTLYQRQAIKLIAAAAAVGCLVLGYGGWIEWQQRTRLKDNGNAWYTHDIKVISMNSNDPSASLDDEQTALDYGRCLVSIPPNHQTGIVESPSITRLELTEDRNRHVVLESINRRPSSDFFHDLNDRLAAGSDEALIFIHGYNVSFNDAVKRTAQISHDVDFQGAPICYSWPSRGGLEDYTRDMANADWSVIHLQEFLATLFERSEARKIHLIAHSMGNRVLMQALDRLALQKRPQTRFGQIVLAAPDVSANDFRQRYCEVIRNMADHVTLYASSRDRALMVSAGVHGHDRAGLAGSEIVIVDGIDTIDVSHVDTSLIGHSYYGDNPELIDDLAAIILQARPTSSRKWLERIDTAANRFYWKFR